jgi:hypothetical protein
MLTMFLLTHLIKLVVNTQLVHTIITQTLIKPGDFKRELGILSRQKVFFPIV